MATEPPTKGEPAPAPASAPKRRFISRELREIAPKHRGRLLNGLLVVWSAAALAVTFAPHTLAAEEETSDEAAATVRDQDAAEDGEETLAGSDRLEEIRVVARRREESLEETPVSVTALGSTILDEAQVRQLDQIQDLVPNMIWNTGFSGVGGNVIIRGVGKGAEDIVFDPGVGIYVDGILLSRDVGQVLPMLDVKQVEVLRGPQGTLFGKNTVGGAVNVRTVKPRDEFEAMLMVGAGNFYSYRTRAMVNVPIVDEKLFMRANWASEQSDGYGRNLRDGSNYSDLGLRSVMASLRYLPTESLTVDVSGSWSRDHRHPKAGNCVPIGSGVAAWFVEGAVFPPGFGPQIPNFQQDLTQQCALSGDLTGPYKFISDQAGISDVESYGVWGTIEFDGGDFWVFEDVILKSITGWRRQNPRLRDDTDTTGLAVVQRSTIQGMPSFFLPFQKPSVQRQITQEFQAINGFWDERINLVTGVYLYWDQADTHQELLSLGGTYLDPNPLLLGLTPSYQSTGTDNFDVAVYTQGTWDIQDWVSLTAGFRWTQETKGTSLRIIRYTDPPVAMTTNNYWLQIATRDEVTYTEWTPMASLLFKVPETWIEPAFDTFNTYFTYSRGFKGGGFSAIQGGTADALFQFRPETVDSFEIGFKATAWRSRIRANLALFLMSYDLIQVATTQPTGTFTVDRVVENAGQATSKGIELELQMLPIDGLLLSASIGYLDARYDTYLNSANNVPRPPPPNPLPPATVDRSGQRFTGIPSLQTNIAGQYAIPIESGWSWVQGNLTPRLEWVYESSIQYAGPELPELLQDGVHRLNARLTWRFYDERAEIALWGQNLTNEAYFRSAIAGTSPTYGFGVRYFDPPRTYGIELRYTF